MTDPTYQPVRTATTRRTVRALNGPGAVERSDLLVTEEPMEIRLQRPGEAPGSVAVTMRTPGHDFELAVGFLVSEGLISDPDAVVTVAYCTSGRSRQEYNIVTVTTREAFELEGPPRQFIASASCGMCGKATLDQLVVRCDPVATGPTIDRTTLLALPDALRAAQSVFDATGGLHAAATFPADGTVGAVREDVGRHNAVDKLIGRAFLDGTLPLSGAVLMLSGRVSYEIVQKAAVAGIPIIGAVSAPSSLAVATADRLGQTLIGFIRGDRANVYSHPDRVRADR